ncbi:hypothetical protein ACQJBY_046276 [Aegilops geniculata]
MERVFSVEEIPDPFWGQPSPRPAGASGGGGAEGAMNRCPSEWYFQKFLEEAVLDSPAADPTPMAGASGAVGGAAQVKQPTAAAAAAAPAATGAVVDPVEYNAMLKQKLEKDLAAVAMWRASGAMPPERFAASPSLPNADVQHIGTINPIGVGNVVPVQNKLAGGASGVSGPHLVQNADALVKQAASSSSREQSEDDDMEGEDEITGNGAPTDQRLRRRKQSNRESARRSRSRKAAHLNELEAQVSQLRVENSSLLRRLADVNQKYNGAAVDNRVLKADVETLRAKVKMAEDSVKRVTGMSALFPAGSDMSSLSMPFTGSPSEATSDAAVPDDLSAYFSTSEAGGHNGYMPEMASSAQEDDNFLNEAMDTGKMGRPDSLHRVASLEHLQKRMCGGPASSGSTS